ncbi:hypothetical protein G6F31_021862 [Rhizopus arrhizus]|nr:hypothetical protein G6F31_021862 [Rhizopus arrhizus]
MRPSDHAGPPLPSWPASRSAWMVVSGKRDSTVRRFSVSVRGQNEPGKWSMCQEGASMASCRFMPIAWRRKNATVHWSCWSPPGVPNAI